MLSIEVLESTLPWTEGNDSGGMEKTQEPFRVAHIFPKRCGAACFAQRSSPTAPEASEVS